MIAQNFSGLFAPAGTPKSIIDQIARATRSAMADGEFRQELIAAGFAVSRLVAGGRAAFHRGRDG